MLSHNIVVRIYINDARTVSRGDGTTEEILFKRNPRLVHAADKSANIKYSSRETTVEPDYNRSLEDNAARRRNGYLYQHCLELKFDTKRSFRPGFLLGAHPDCDVVLPGLEGISRRQCVITFDDSGRVVVRDIRSHTTRCYGTAVTYFEHEQPKFRAGFTWILSRYTAPSDSNNIVTLFLGPDLQLLLVVPPHDINSVQHLNKVAQFRKAVECNLSCLVAFDGLGVQSLAATAVPSYGGSPLNEPYLLELDELGRGSQAVVKKVWDVSTGTYYAAKRPLKSASTKELVLEAGLMASMNHVWHQHPAIILFRFS
jgi:hypothetical protein